MKPATTKASHITDAAGWISENFNYSKTAVYKAPIASAHGPYTIVPGSTCERSALALPNKRWPWRARGWRRS